MTVRPRQRAADLLTAAHTTGTAIGAFNVVLLEHAEAIVTGAQLAGLPVILQISENCVLYHGSLVPLAQACLAIAREATVDVVVHLDHITDPDLVEEGIRLGVDSIMFDASSRPYIENAAETKRVVSLCHAANIPVEAELGHIGGKAGSHSSGARTDPHQATEFAATTGIDALAVAVGTTHAMTSRVASVDEALIAELRDSTPVPLVLHGSSGLSDRELATAVSAGISKVNISTHLNSIFTQALRDELLRQPNLVDPRTYVSRGRDAIAAETERLLSLLHR